MLDQKNCQSCPSDTSPLDTQAINKYLAGLDNWQLHHDRNKIYCEYTFKNFIDALEFVNKVGAICEKENHHPDINFGWGFCQIIFYSHNIKGLHENDFIMAAKTTQLFNKMSGQQRN